jgi:hypothetical protein
MGKGYLVLLVLSALALCSCAPAPESPARTPGPTPASVPTLAEVQETKNVIQTNVQDTTVHYIRESFWSDTHFAAIVENKAEFTSRLVDEFINTVSGYGEAVVNVEVTFDSEREATTLNCEVTGAISKTGNRYYATFEWLIRPLGLDFIDDDFGETEEGLFWEGDINGIATVLEARFPYTGSAYKAWSHPTGHCHAHVWWEF